MTRRILLIVSAALAVLGLSPVTHAGQLGTTIPANCVEHVPFGGGTDAPGDYRCAGMAVDFHVDGAQWSPFPIWAGQWLFVDPDGQFRVGSCTFNRGVHPNVLGPSAPVEQAFPNDPTGEKRAYLTWRYGDTTDNATAAALWAVFHFYAQDAAGTNRSSGGTVPLVTDLWRVGEMTGNQGLEDLALALDAEAERHRGPYGLSLTVRPDGVVSVLVGAGSQPVSGVPIAVHVPGDDAEYSMQTVADGIAETVVTLPPGVITVSVVAGVPGPAAVFRGSAASPDPHGAQTLLTGGSPALLTANTTIDVPTPTTVPETVPETTVPETTVPETTVPETTTTVEATTTTTVPVTTLPETTTTVEETTSTTTVPVTTLPETATPETTPETSPPTSLEPEVPVIAEVTTVPEPTATLSHAEPSTTPPLPIETAPPPAEPLTSVATTTVLPRTGGGAQRIAYLATSLLVGGIGLAGGASRPRRT